MPSEPSSSSAGAVFVLFSADEIGCRLAGGHNAIVFLFKSEANAVPQVVEIGGGTRTTLENGDSEKLKTLRP